MDGSQNNNHEDHIAGRGMNSLSHYNLVHKDPLLFASYAKDMGKTGADESQKQERSDRRSKE